MDHQIIRSRSFQAAVQPWLLECFGPAIAGDVVERNHRFLEEAIELVQSKGCTRSEAHQLVDYVFDRPVGDPAQEVGGVMVTLAALCLAAGIDMHVAGYDELRRIWTKTDEIRAKQAAKPQHSPLPQAPHATWTKLPAGYLIVRAPFLWGPGESAAWHKAIPDVHKAFYLLAAATPGPHGTDAAKKLAVALAEVKITASVASPLGGAAAPDDSARLDAVLQHSWELHCFDMPTGQGDGDIGWKVVEHTKLGDVEIAVVYEDDPRRAIDEAMLATAPEASHD